MTSDAERLLMSAITTVQRQEAMSMVETLAAASDDQLVSLMTIVSAFRLDMDKRSDASLLHPADVADDPTWCIRTSVIMQEFKRTMEFEKANGLAIWLFTVRAAEDSALRDTGVAIWKELARVFPKLSALETHPKADPNTRVILAEAQKIPDGMMSTH
jgi:hypothetical protein